MYPVLRKAILLFPVLMFIFFTACDDNSVNNTRYTATESFEYSFNLENQNMLRMVVLNSEININGVEDLTVISITGEKKVISNNPQDAQEQLEFLELTVSNLTNIIYIETDHPNNSGGREYTVDFEILVPMDFLLNINNVNGTVRIDSLENDIVITLVNGNVIFNDIYGNCFIDIVNGQFIGNIEMPLNGINNIAVVNGLIDLAIPQSTSSEFSATVLNGNISIMNLNMSNQEITENSVTGILGNGDGNISLNVTNGNIEVLGY
jgi:hypothetical protein